jgi:hypothetical protein
MKNQHFDDLIENLHDLKFKSEKDIYLFMLKHGKNKYVQVNKMTPIVGRPPLTREEILKDNPLILNIQPDVNELVSKKIREIFIMGNGRAYLENVKKVFKEYDFHIPLPMKNFYIEFPRNGFGISKIQLSNASKDELGSFDLLAIYLKVTYIDGKIKYDFFLQTKTYLNGNFQSKILNHISYNEKEFIQQITNDTTPIFHLITYALSKGITDCYLAGVRQDRDITIKNEHGNKVKLKYPSSVIVYNHKQYEPNPESNVIIDYFGEGRNVIGHYRHYYLKDAYKQRIIGTDGYWILDITKPEEGGKNEFGDRPGTDFLKGRTYVNAQLKSKEHQTFITKYVKLENEKTGVNMRRNPMREKTLEQERAFSEIYGYDTYFQSAEENEQGINSKDSIAFKNEVRFLIRELGVGVVLDLDSQMLSETAQVLLRRALDEEVPGFSTMFEKKSNPRRMRRNPKPISSQEALETISPMTMQYLVTALWSETDYDSGEPLDSKYDLEDIEPQFILDSEKECLEFLEKAKPYLTDEEYEDDESIGHNFWLNRNGHGAGFWDGDYEQGDKLSDIAHSFGEVYIQEAIK